MPADTAPILAAHRPLRPGAAALGVTQDRLVEKSFVADLGLPVAQIMRGPTEVVARAKIDVLKTNRLPSAAAFEDAANSAAPIRLLPTEGRVFAALLRMPAYDDAVLMAQREVSQLPLALPGLSRAAAA